MIKPHLTRIPTAHGTVDSIVLDIANTDFELGIYVYRLPSETGEANDLLVVGRTLGTEGRAVVLGPSTVVPTHMEGEVTVSKGAVHVEYDTDVSDDEATFSVGILNDLLALTSSSTTLPHVVSMPTPA